MFRTPVLASLLLAAAVAAPAADLTLDVSGPVTGTLYAAVYAAADGWLQDGRAVAQQRGAGKRFVFAGLAPGRYAVTVFEDTNGNGQLDRNLLGVPTERYAFSRDARGRMGPPAFEEAAFELGANATITVKLP